MSSPFPAGVTKPFVALAAFLALFLGVQVASASAATIGISPEKVKSSELVAPSYKTVAIVGSGFLAYKGNENVRVGLCSEGNIGVPALAPGCGLLDKTFVITNGGLLFGAVKLVPAAEKAGTAVFPNEHFGQIPGQPENIDCAALQTAGSNCDIVVVDHSTHAVIASADITFE
jgi:hypothetical protein